MKKLFKNAIPTMAMLLVAILSLSGVTYAWFTAGNQATVDTIDVGVQSVDGLAVSLTGYNGSWGSTLRPDFSTQKTTLKPVSAFYQNDDTKSIDFFTTEFNNIFDAIESSSKVASQDNGTYGHYLSFDFFIKNEGAEKEVNIDGTVFTSSGLSRSAARIAFVTKGSASAAAVLNDKTSPACDDTISNIAVYEPNSTEHSADALSWYAANGIQNPKTVKVPTKAVSKEVEKTDGVYYSVAGGDKYAKAESNLSYPTGDETAVEKAISGKYVFDETAASRFRALSTSDFYTVISHTKAMTGVAADSPNVYILSDKGYTQVAKDTSLDIKTTYYERVDVSYYTKTENSTEKFLTEVETETNEKNCFITVPANSIVKVTVFIWIEGQDADCTDYVAGIPFKVDIKLNKKT